MLALATLTLIGLCLPLWFDNTGFPRVPFLRWWPGYAAFVSELCLLGLGICLINVAAGAERTWSARLSLAFLIILVLGEQGRLQPWLYQAILELLILGFAPPELQRRLCQYVFASIYAYSGISKLDHSFLHELGPLFLKTFLAIGGSNADGWPPVLSGVAILAMPLAEIVIAGLLLGRRTTRLGIAGACLLHLALLLLVGPLGLRHSNTVFGWNAALLIQVPLLFWPGAEPTSVWLGRDARKGTARWLILALLLMPLGERWGVWDSWPSFAVYASHNERVEVYVSAEERLFWPEEIQPYLVPTDRADTLRLDITNWSRFMRGVPAYPQARTGVGIALGLIDNIRANRPLYARVLARAHWWTGDRRVIAEGGPDQLRQAADQFFWNGLPARQSLRWIPRTTRPRSGVEF